MDIELLGGQHIMLPSRLVAFSDLTGSTENDLYILT